MPLFTFWSMVCMFNVCGSFWLGPDGEKSDNMGGKIKLCKIAEVHRCVRGGGTQNWKNFVTWWNYWAVHLRYSLSQVPYSLKVLTLSKVCPFTVSDGTTFILRKWVIDICYSYEPASFAAHRVPNPPPSGGLEHISKIFGDATALHLLAPKWKFAPLNLIYNKHW